MPNSQIVTLSTSLKKKKIYCTEAPVSILALRLFSVAKSTKLYKRIYRVGPNCFIESYITYVKGEYPTLKNGKVFFFQKEKQYFRV